MAATMNKQQVEHLQKRLQSAIEKAKDNYANKLPKIKELTWADKYAAIKSGKAKLLPQDKVNGYTDIRLAFVFPEQEKKDALQKKQDEQIGKFTAPLYAEARVIMDAAILGGAEQALDALKNFMSDLKV